MDFVFGFGGITGLWVSEIVQAIILHPGWDIGILQYESIFHIFKKRSSGNYKEPAFVEAETQPMTITLFG